MKTRAASSLPRTGLLPITVGCTGHRDIRPEDLDRLRKETREQLESFFDKYPHTPLLLLSSLAEGADRLVAREFLNLKSRHPSRLKLIAVLPFAKQWYMDDFKPGRSLYHSGDSCEDFENLLSQADGCVELRPVSGEEAKTPGPVRDAYYEEAGKYIAYHSQVLLALWNGKKSGRVGGTDSIVQHMRDGLPRDKERLDDPDKGLFIQIETPRQQHPETIHAYRDGKEHQEWLKQKGKSERIFDQIDVFNKEASTIDLKAVRISRDNLVSPEVASHLTNTENRLLDSYAISDRLAIDHARRARRKTRGLFVIVFIAAIALHIFAHWPPFHLSSKSVEPWTYTEIAAIWVFVGLTLAGRFFFYGEARESHKQHLDYRALAEGLRVQFFWNVAGMSLSVADLYLRKQRSEMDWIIHGIRTWSAGRDHENASNPQQKRPSRDCIEFVTTYWITSQKTFFKKEGKSQVEKLHRLHGWSAAAFATGLTLSGLAAIVLLGQVFRIESAIEIASLLKEYMGCFVLGCGALFLITGLLHAYAHQIGLAEHSKQYLSMAPLLERIETTLTEALNEWENGQTDVSNVLLRAGTEALVENGDWLLLHRERPPELPHA